MGASLRAKNSFAHNCFLQRFSDIFQGYRKGPALREMYPYLEFFWCVFSRIRTEHFPVSLRVQSECGKIRTRKTRNTDTFMQCSGMKWVKRLLNYKLSNNDCDGTQMRNSLVRKRTLKFQISRLLRRVQIHSIRYVKNTLYAYLCFYT